MLGFIAIVLVIIFYSSLSGRIKKIEEKILGNELLNSASSAMPILEKSPVEKNENNQESPAVVLVDKKTDIPFENSNISVDNLPEEKSSLEKFFAWLADEWPLKTGIFLLILAVGWFVTYAFINDWIGEVGRITLGVMFGIVMLFLGFYRANTHQIQGNALLILGSTSVLVSIISGIGIYHLFPANIALIVAFILVGFMSMAAWKQKNLALGIVTYLMGSIVPVFVFNSVDFSVTFFYLFILTAGTLWVTSQTGWNSLNIISLAVVFGYSIAYDNFGGFRDATKDLLFAFTFIFLFYFANIFTILYKKLSNNYDLVVAGGVGLLFLVWMLMVAPHQALVYLIILGAFLFAGGSYVIFLLTKLKFPVILYAAVAVVLLVSATAVQFKGWELMVAYIIEFSLFIMISLYLKNKEGYTGKSVESSGAILYISLLIFSFSNIERIFNYLSYRYYDLDSKIANYHINRAQEMDISSDLLVLFLMGIMSFIISIFIMQVFRKDDKITDSHLSLACFYGAIGGFYAVILIWVMSHLIFADQTFSTIVALIIYTLAGVFFYTLGKKNEHNFYKSIGGFLFGIVLFRLFFFEFADMDMVGKIITFFLVGILFVSTTFIGRKNKKDDILIS